MKWIAELLAALRMRIPAGGNQKPTLAFPPFSSALAKEDRIPMAHAIENVQTNALEIYLLILKSLPCCLKVDENQTK